MTDYRPIAGIAWDDEPEYFEKVLEKLQGTFSSVSFRVTDKVDEFRKWIDQPGYEFALLDIFRMNEPVEGQATPEGLNLCVELRKSNAEMPLILATDLYDTIDRETKTSWDLGATTYLWSKQLRVNWFAQDLVQLLDSRGLVVEKNSLLVLGDVSAQKRQELEFLLGEAGINATFEFTLDGTRNWDDVAARIRSFAAFLVVTASSEKDRVAFDIGRLVAVPRVKDRLIVDCKQDDFPWLNRFGVGRTGESDMANQETSAALIARIKLSMQ